SFQTALVAQWKRALLCEGRGRPFESGRGHHKIEVRYLRDGSRVVQAAACKAANAGSNPARRLIENEGNPMVTKDDLGDRMKCSYESRTRFFLPRRTYTLIRVDGKAFHTYTRACARPYDLDLMADM